MKLKKLIAGLMAVVILAIALPYQSVYGADYVSQKINAIKSAWTMLEKPVFEIMPGINSTHKAITPEFAYYTDESYLPEGVTVDRALTGEYYTKVTVSATGTPNTEAGRGSDDSAFLRYQSKAESLASYNVRLSFYVEKLNGSLEFVPFFRYNSTGGGYTSKLYSVTESDVGHWVTLTSTELKGRDWSKVVNVNNNVLLGINSDSDNVFFVGSFIITEALPLPAGSEDWGLSRWQEAAKNLDLSEYYNGEELEKAVNDSNISEEDVVAEIKQAWTQMEKIDFEIAPGASAAAIQAVYSPDAQLPDGVLSNKFVGESYAKAVFASATSTVSVPSQVGSSYLKYVSSAAAIYPGRHNVYFSFYIEELKGELSFVPYFRYGRLGDGSNTGKEYTVKAEDVGHWVTLDVDDITGTKWSNVTNVRNSLVLGINSSDLNTVYCGSFIFTRKVGLPEGSEDWNLARWRQEYCSLDLSDYFNTEPLAAAFKNDSVFAAIDGIKQAWLQVKDTLEIGPAVNEAHNGITPQFIYYTDSSYLPEGVTADREVVGEYYTKVTTPDTGTGSPSTEASRGDDSVFLRYQGKAESPIDYEISFSFYIEQLNGNLSFVPYFRYGSSGGSNTGKLYNVTQEDVGHWVTLTSEDIKGSEWDKIINIKNQLLLGINSDEQNVIYFGDFLLYKNSKIELPSDSGDWSLATWVAQATEFMKGKQNTKALKSAVEEAKALINRMGETDLYTIENGEFDSERISSIGNNLLVGKTVRVRVGGHNTSTGIAAIKNLYDNDPSTAYSLSDASWNDGIDDSKFCELYFDLGDTYKIDKLLFNSWNQKHLETGRYEVYLANTYSQLSNPESMIISYNNMSDSEMGTNVSQLFTFKASNNISGRYICFKILCGVSDFEKALAAYRGLLYMRISDLGVYGEVCEETEKPTNMLRSIVPDVFRIGNNSRIKINEIEISDSMALSLADNDYINALQIKSNGEQLDFVYELNENIKLSKVNLYSSQCDISSFKVYAGKASDGIWQESALIYSSDTTEPQSEIKCSFESSPTVKYIRFSVFSGNEYFSPTELEAIGIKDNDTAYKNLLLGKASAVTLSSMDLTTGATSSIGDYANKDYASVKQLKGYMTDGNPSSVYDVYFAQKGSSSIDITVDLGAVYSVDSIIMRGGSDSNHWPSKMKIYADENLSAINSLNSNPSCAFDEKSDNGVYCYSSNGKAARYIRFSITEAENPYLKSNMLAVISELEVMGTQSGDYSSENADAALTFTDSKTGVKVEILKNSAADSFSAVAGIAVTKEAASLSEKTSIWDSAKMIYGAEKYSVALLDGNGNRIYDIGGRAVKVFLPPPSGENIMLMQIGASNGTSVIPTITDTSGDRLMAEITDLKNLSLTAITDVTAYPDGYFEDAYRIEDVNRDGFSNAGDLLIIRGLLLGFDIEYKGSCDINGDTFFDLRDFVRMKKILAN